MRIPLAACLLVFRAVLLVAQAPTPAATNEPASAPAPAASSNTAPAAQIENSKVGFSSVMPGDWQPVAPPPAPKIAVPYPTAEAPKKGDACIEVSMTARHGSSSSVVVVVALPFDCYGQSMTPNDLVDFGLGAAAGLKQSFDIVSQVQGNYTLGSHPIWIERADGTPKGRPESPYTFEIACTVLGKGAACWLTMAGDADSLRDFEQQAVQLEGDEFNALVPSGAAPKVPAAAPRKPS